MHNDKLVAMLMQAADNMRDLAERIEAYERGDYGARPITQRERTMIRAALVPYVQDIADGIILNHIQGIPQDYAALKDSLSALEVL